MGDGTDIVDKEIYAFQTKGKDRVALRPEGTAAVMRSYIQHGMQSLPQPIMLYYCEPMFRHDRPQKGRYRQHHQFGMEILGTPKPVADAIIIQTTVTILREVGAKNIFVSINSIGDKDSRNEYIKALKAYYRKHINDLPALDRERLNTNPLRILDSKEPKTIAINQDAPSSLDYLGNEAKKHFKQVLEYLEEADIPYELNKNLVRGLDYYSNTVFEIMETIIDEDGTERTLSITGGGRYDYLART
ncbi:MAG: histidine--tRNA ligase, partial [Candidatus Pacebacteria bacterium]|nr:histidine--tRNA ligase [Candidatus Paceibacterota bacterium]